MIVAWDLTVADTPPSNNLFLGNSHNFNVYRREKERWQWKIKMAIGKNNTLKAPLERAEVCITYFFPDKRRRDPDNYSGKFILDALVREGVLVDDSFDNIRLSLAAELDRDFPRTEIRLMWVAEE